MSQRQEAIAELYYRSNSVDPTPHTISAHRTNPDLPLSPYKLTYPSYPKPGSELMPEMLGLIGQEFYELFQSAHLSPTIRKRLAGVPRSGLPLAEAHAKQHPKYPTNVVLFAKSETPGQPKFSGPIGPSSPDDELILHEDHVSTGNSLNSVAEVAIRNAGLFTHTAFAVIDRQQGATENLLARDINLISIMTAEVLFAAGVQLNQLTQTQSDCFMEYAMDNQMLNDVAQDAARQYSLF
jgi:orotate phosphoribosyltransferase